MPQHLTHSACRRICRCTCCGAGAALLGESAWSEYDVRPPEEQRQVLSLPFPAAVKEGHRKDVFGKDGSSSILANIMRGSFTATSLCKILEHVEGCCESKKRLAKMLQDCLNRAPLSIQRKRQDVEVDSFEIKRRGRQEMLPTIEPLLLELSRLRSLLHSQTSNLRDENELLTNYSRKVLTLFKFTLQKLRLAYATSAQREGEDEGDDRNEELLNLYEKTVNELREHEKKVQEAMQEVIAEQMQRNIDQLKADTVQKALRSREEAAAERKKQAEIEVSHLRELLNAARDESQRASEAASERVRRSELLSEKLVADLKQQLNREKDTTEASKQEFRQREADLLRRLEETQARLKQAERVSQTAQEDTAAKLRSLEQALAAARAEQDEAAKRLRAQHKQELQDQAQQGKEVELRLRTEIEEARNQVRSFMQKHSSALTSNEELSSQIMHAKQLTERLRSERDQAREEYEKLKSAVRAPPVRKQLRNPAVNILSKSLKLNREKMKTLFEIRIKSRQLKRHSGVSTVHFDPVARVRSPTKLPPPPRQLASPAQPKLTELQKQLLSKADAVSHDLLARKPNADELAAIAVTGASQARSPTSAKRFT